MPKALDKDKLSELVDVMLDMVDPSELPDEKVDTPLDRSESRFVCGGTSYWLVRIGVGGLCGS
jgi:hypothetical protein